MKTMFLFTALLTVAPCVAAAAHPPDSNKPRPQATRGPEKFDPKFDAQEAYIAPNLTAIGKYQTGLC